jgi:hypothetical protein
MILPQHILERAGTVFSGKNLITHARYSSRFILHPQGLSKSNAEKCAASRQAEQEYAPHVTGIHVYGLIRGMHQVS